MIPAIPIPRELALLEQSKALLAECKTVDEVKSIRDKAEALRQYAKQQGECLEIQNAAAEIKIRAERRAGELIKVMPKSKGAATPKRTSPEPTRSHDEIASAPSLKDMGIDHNQASRWQSIASVPEEDFEEHIVEKKKGQKELTSAGLHKLAKSMEARKPAEPSPIVKAKSAVVGSLSELLSAGKRFPTIYADPPWQYGNQGTRASTGDHYDTMTIDQICAEPVAQLVEDNAHLHLWTTNAFLFDARRVMEAWGFEYKSCFVWVKPQMGMGNYWRVSHEFMLFGIRGSLPFHVRDEMSWGQFDRGRHSEKPDGMRSKIERVSPGPYLEMYGRAALPGTEWTVYGNQVDGRLFG